MTLDEKFDIVQFERQAKASVMIQTLLDFWESGHEEVPGLTREFVQETIEYAAGVDDAVVDVLVRGHEMYDSNNRSLLEETLGRENISIKGKWNTINKRFDKHHPQRLLLGELLELYHSLPLLRFVLTDFFTIPEHEKRYSNGVGGSTKRGEPYSLRKILYDYSIPQHRTEAGKGTGLRLVRRIYGSSDEKTDDSLVEMKWLRRTGFDEKFRQHSLSKVYWFTEDVELFREIIFDFLYIAKEDNRFQRGTYGNRRGQPYTLLCVMLVYSTKEHIILTEGKHRYGPGTILYRRILGMEPEERAETLNELVERSGLKDDIDRYSKSWLYWFSEEIELARQAFNIFFDSAPLQKRYRKSGEHNNPDSKKGQPYSVESIMGMFNFENLYMEKVGGSARIVRNKLARIKNEEQRKEATVLLLKKTGYFQIYNEYAGENRIWHPSEIEDAKLQFDDFFRTPTPERIYVKKRGKTVISGSPYPPELILQGYSRADHLMYGNQRNTAYFFERLKSMAPEKRDQAMQNLLKHTGFAQIFALYQQSTAENPFKYQPPAIPQLPLLDFLPKPVSSD